MSIINDIQSAYTNATNLLGLGGNVQPQSTNITYNPDGSQDITHKMTAAPVSPEQNNYQIPQNFGMSSPITGWENTGAQQYAPVKPQQAVQAPQVQAAPVAQPPVQQQMQQPPVQQPPVQQQMQQPVQQTAQQPMSNIAAIQQIESGGNPNLIGAAKETGSMQVLPSTLTNPGFGVKPAQDNSPAEKDRVGQDYYNAMLPRYNNNPLLAAAAYNAGPGTVDRAVAQAAQTGANPLQLLPDSTKQYLAKFAKLTGHTDGVPDMAAAKEPWKIAQSDIALPGQEHRAEHEELNRNLTNTGKLSNIIDNPDTSPGVRSGAIDQAKGLLTNQQDKTRAESAYKGALQGDPAAQNYLANEYKKDGSWGKLLLATYMGWKDMAAEQQAKLMDKGVYTPVQVGDKTYTAKMSPDGLITKAWDSDTGAPVDNRGLANIQANSYGVGKANKATVSTQDVENGSLKGRVVTQQLPNGRTRTYVESGGKQYDYDGSWKPVSISVANAKAQARADIDTLATLKKTYGKDTISALNQFKKDADHTLSRQEESDFVRDYGGYTPPELSNPTGSTTNAVSQPTNSTATTNVQPGAMGGGGGTTNPAGAGNAATNVAPTGNAANAVFRGRQTGESEGQYAQAKKNFQEQQKIQQGAQAAVAKPNAATVAASQDTQNLISHMDRVVQDIDAGETNFGSRASAIVGRGPIAQWVGNEFETKQANNTKMALDAISKLATEGLKVLGANPSEGDRKFWTEHKPNISSSPEFVKDWIETRRADLERRLAYAQQQVSTGGLAGTAGPVKPETARLGTRENPIKLD